jgi:uncharacterized membrane protein YdcZ (DUF606 family)
LDIDRDRGRRQLRISAGSQRWFARTEIGSGLGSFNAATMMSWSRLSFGSIYVAILIVLTLRLGATIAIALVVAGQMPGSIAFPSH